LAFNNPTPQTEDLYIKSINTTVDEYRIFLKEQGTDTRAAHCDFDTGQALIPISGSVRNTATLLEVLVAMKIAPIPGLDRASA